ncbi:MAG: site-specific DNA-methyltransferase [Ruminococcus flavefaciens]|nr:site-specific DNA-methyltransferase [Ruminococcus flavefaciens]
MTNFLENLDADFISDNMLIHGDCMKVMSFLSINYAQKIKCIYLDPPYGSNTRNEHYNDIYTVDQYQEFITHALILAKNLLMDEGVIFFQISMSQAFVVKDMLDNIFGKLNYRNQIIISRNDHKRYKRCIAHLHYGYDVIFVYTKYSSVKMPPLIEKVITGYQVGEWASFYTTSIRYRHQYSLFGITPDKGEWRYNKEWAMKAVKNYQELQQCYNSFELDNICNFDNIYQEYCKRRSETDTLQLLRLNHGKIEYYIPSTEIKYITDNWSDINMRGNLTSFEHEVDEKVIERILRWVTCEGDIVLDPFLGSGTTAVVATRLHRKWIGIEKENYCNTLIKERVSNEIKISGNPEWEYRFIEC